MPITQDRKIVILGGGFAGVNLAQKLKGVAGIQVTIIDQNNYNFFTPLLYQVATGLLEVSSISLPFRSLFEGAKNIHFRLGKVLSVSRETKTVELSTGTVPYDELVIAIGTKSNFFGNENIQQKSLPMKTIYDAVDLRNYLLQQFEAATYTADPVARKKIQTIVVSGAGPSGVEIAGMLAQMRNSILGHLYPEVDEMQIEIHLVDGGPAVLGPMSEESHKYAQKTLEEMGVKIKLNTLVSDYKDDTVFLNDNTAIGAKTLIWTAGVTGIKIPGLPEEIYQRGGRMAVNAFNQAQGIPNVWVIGDAAVEMENAEYPHGHPQLASVATQQGTHLAHNFKRLSAGKTLEPFKYKDKGTMAIIGRGKAVAELTIPSKKTLTGWLAWAAWLFIHLFLLISYRNRLKTMWSWTSAYFSPRRPLGLMVLKRADIERATPKGIQ